MFFFLKHISEEKKTKYIFSILKKIKKFKINLKIKIKTDKNKSAK